MSDLLGGGSSLKKELFKRGFDVSVIEDLTYNNTGVIKLLVKW